MFGSSKFSFSSSGFGTTTTTTTSTGGLFGSSLFSTATTTSAPSTFGGLGSFGGLTGSSTFGSSNAFKPATTSAFGISTATTPAIGTGTTIKFEPVISTDMMKKGAINQKQSVKFMAITAMTQYQSKSFEELRLEDYAANRKSGSSLSLFKPAIGATSPFASTVTSTAGSSWFNKPFGSLTSTATTTASSSVFGSGTTSKPLFQSGTFGLNTSLTSTPSSGTGFSFGSPATTTQSSIFGQPATGSSLFSTPTTTSASTFSLFGSNTATTTSSGGLFSFGSTATTSATSSLFSQNKPLGTSPFGSGGLFSSTTSAATTTTASSSPFSFGLAAKPATNIFGQPSTSTSTFSFGQTPAASQAAPSATSSIFGAAGAASTSGGATPSSANTLLLLAASKDKDPEVMKRSAQMLLRAQCFSYSDDPIFQDFTPVTSEQNVRKPVQSTSSTDIKSPEPLGRRVRSLLSSSAMSINGLYRSLDREFKPESLEVRGGRSSDLKRLVLPSNRNSIKLESPNHSVKSTPEEKTLGDYLLDSSRSFRGGEAIDIEDEKVSCCKLTRPGYNTCPSLQKLSLDSASGTCLVSDFAIYREGYGSITWPGLTDIAGMDLDKIVFIRRKEVIVYPDDDDKPPLGEGLNKPAEITLHSVYPLDKETKQQIKDPLTLDNMNFDRFLEETTHRMGAHFIDYDTSTGSWTFKVDHFTRYGLDYADATIDYSQTSVLNQNFSRWQSKPKKNGDTADVLGISRFAPNAFSTVLNGETEKVEESLPVIEKEENGIPVKELTRRMSSMASDFSKEEEDMDEYITESPGLADVSCFNIERFAPFWIPWSNSLCNTDRNLLWDPAFLKSRTFRFNMIGARRTCFTLAGNSLITVQGTEIAPDCREDATLNWLLTAQFNCTQIESSNSPYPHVKIRKSLEYMQRLEIIPTDLCTNYLAQCVKTSVSLLQILFNATLDGKDRKERLLQWLLEARASDKTIVKSNSGIYSTILDSLCNLDRKSAVSTALSSRHYRLAQLLSIPPGHSAVQNLLKTQLVHWCDNEADKFIDKEMLKIYLLISGELFIEMSDGSFLSLICDRNWIENLILILRYSCLIDAPCTNGIILLDNLMRSGLCPSSDDYCWNILKFFVDSATTDVSELLQPNEFFQSDDYRLSWHLLQAVQSLAVGNIPQDINDYLCQQFSRQLEACGRCDWAGYVLSHVEIPQNRETLCDSFLQRIVCADHDFNSVENWLVNQLGWSRQRIHLAKSYRAQYSKNWFLCCDHRLQAEDYSSALAMVFDRLLPEAFCKDDRSDVVQLLELLDSYVNNGTVVDGWKESGQFLHQYFKAQLKFASQQNWSADENRLLQFSEDIAADFGRLSRLFVEVATEQRIAVYILRTIGEGICSSMRLLCKWIADVTYKQASQHQRAISIVESSKAIFDNIDRLSYSD